MQGLNNDELATKFTTMRAVAEQTEQMLSHIPLDTQVKDKRKKFSIVEIGNLGQSANESEKVYMEQKRDF